MPELPEVETVKRGITPWVINKTIKQVIVRQPKLRWPIPNKLGSILKEQKIVNVDRRGKYLIFKCTNNGALIVHLGMSGSLCIFDNHQKLSKHDHLDIVFDTFRLKYNDPRRFGAILWTDQPVEQHKLLSHLGPEPLSRQFDAKYLINVVKRRKICIKQAIMDGKIVVGVGNIYANEALFLAGIHPARPSAEITENEAKLLIKNIKMTLKSAIKQGGTTLKDFKNSEGNPGYFSIKLNVYGKKGEPCPKCKQPLQEIRQNNRSSVFCHLCQS